ncbi:MAG: UDP-N-acetylglucosamine 3-dehydrogenase, partial [Abditibacteriota bacterium]|nr:UDP-N-acetylglucosamine 3-dehydrogenase [Abditibacteriota bacterium]
MLKVAVVGAGHIGHTHARCYRDHAKTDLVAVCDAVPEKAQAFAQTFGVRAYQSVAEMLQNEELGAVSVATAGVENGSHHFEPTMQCLEARVPVLCEKPISNDIGEARQMVAKSRELKVPLGINLNHRFTPAAARLKQMQTDGEFGEVLFINMALWFSNPNDPPPYQHIRALHPHSIDVMRFFGGDIKRVQCFMLRAPGKSSSWSTLALNVQFASGAVGHLTGSQDMSWNHAIERCEVAGSKGRAVIANVFERLEWYPREDKAVRVWNNGIFGGMGE